MQNCLLNYLVSTQQIKIRADNSMQGKYVLIRLVHTSVADPDPRIRMFRQIQRLFSRIRILAALTVFLH